MSAVAESCVACGRAFTPRAKPRWAFTAEGRPAGRVHASCLLPRGHRYCPGDISQEVGRFLVWEWEMQPSRPDPHSARWWAGFLISRADDVREALNDEQEALMRHWVGQDRVAVKESDLEGIRSEYAFLVREFIAWRTGLEQSALPAGACS
jgi:hypothetical protein